MVNNEVMEAQKLSLATGTSCFTNMSKAIDLP